LLKITSSVQGYMVDTCTIACCWLCETISDTKYLNINLLEKWRCQHNKRATNKHCLSCSSHCRV